LVVPASEVSTRLYEHPLSSYAQKIKIVLREKGLPFESITPDDLGTGKVDGPLAKANPRLLRRDPAARVFARETEAVKGMGANHDRYRGTGAKREYRDHRLEWMIKSGGVGVVLAGLRDRNIRPTWPGN
jgi:hypothetical protein